MQGNSPNSFASIRLQDSPRSGIAIKKSFFWNCEGWLAYREQVLLFHVVEEAEYVVNNVMKGLFASITMWSYKTDVEVEVFGANH